MLLERIMFALVTTSIICYALWFSRETIVINNIFQLDIRDNPRNSEQNSEVKMTFAKIALNIYIKIINKYSRQRNMRLYK